MRDPVRSLPWQQSCAPLRGRVLAATVCLLALVGVGACSSSSSWLSEAGCPGLRPDTTSADFLEAWAEPEALDDSPCVLPGRLGPEPAFATSDLGEQQHLYPGEVPADVLERFEGEQIPPPLSERYPIVHLGRVGEGDSHLFIAWRDVLGGPVICVESNCEPSVEVPDEATIRSTGRGGGTREVSINLWVPEETAVVALEVDGHAEGWQRPVARAALLVAPLEWASVDDFVRFAERGMEARITFFDAAGEVIETITETLSF